MVNSIKDTILRHQLVRDAVDSIKKQFPKGRTKEIFEIFLKYGRISGLVGVYTLDGASQGRMQKLEDNFQERALAAKTNTAALATLKKEYRALVEEAIESVTAVPGVCQEGEGTAHLIASSGEYEFGDQKRVTVQAQLSECSITVGADCHVIVEPQAQALTIYLGANSTVTLQHGVHDCMILPTGAGKVHFGPSTYENVVTGGRVTVTEDQSARNNTY